MSSKYYCDRCGREIHREPDYPSYQGFPITINQPKPNKFDRKDFEVCIYCSIEYDQLLVEFDDKFNSWFKENAKSAK